MLLTGDEFPLPEQAVDRTGGEVLLPKRFGAIMDSICPICSKRVYRMDTQMAVEGGTCHAECFKVSDDSLHPRTRGCPCVYLRFLLVCDGSASTADANSHY